MERDSTTLPAMTRVSWRISWKQTSPAVAVAEATAKGGVAVARAAKAGQLLALAAKVGVDAGRRASERGVAGASAAKVAGNVEEDEVGAGTGRRRGEEHAGSAPEVKAAKAQAQQAQRQAKAPRVLARNQQALGRHQRMKKLPKLQPLQNPPTMMREIKTARMRNRRRWTSP